LRDRHEPALLSDVEIEIAGLVACGLTNRQVGERVFLSRHTVDSHLRHIFRKLGINSRVELAAIVAGGGLQCVATAGGRR
jgi:DNA-binding CsgD family transcriptional regulator